MIEAVMYMAIGFLAAELLALFVMPLVHGRAVRLTMRRMEAALPVSVDELRAHNDLLRAQSAMSTRRLELQLEKFRDQNAKLLVELGKKADIANRVMAERDAVKVENKSLYAQLAALGRQGSGGEQRRRAQAHVVRQMTPRRLVS